MAKSTVANLITQVKRRADYNISDSSLDNLIVDMINDSVGRVRQKLLDRGLFADISKSSYLITTPDQAYVDLYKARIMGNVASFTAVAGDTITVTIDGTAYTTAALTGAVAVSTVVTAINLATAAIGDVASVSDDGYLIIESPTSGATSSVTIADGAGTPASRLFTNALQRTQSALTDFDEIIVQSERTGDKTIRLVPYDVFVKMYPDPTTNTSNIPIHAARWDNKIFFGPTPSKELTLYFDFIKLFSTLTSASTMPIQDKYDRLLVAMCVAELKEWLGLDSIQLTAALAREKRLDDEIFLGATNVGMVRASASRRSGAIFDPLKPMSTGYEYGIGFYY